MASQSNSQPIPCLACAKARLIEIPGYRAFNRVTSDCKTWPAGGKVWVCQNCGFAQAANDAQFNKEIEAIYGSYSTYHQSAGGAEQMVFEQQSGAAASRSQRLLETLKAKHGLAGTGRMLDIGCGNGPMLRAFSKIAPGWKLAGSEIDARNKQAVESIRNAEALYTCPVSEIPGKFDLITMSHVLEHVIDPIALLQSLPMKLTPDGVLLLLVPGIQENPVIMLVADHRSHFTAGSFSYLVSQAGLEVVHEGAWVQKELAIVARGRAGGQTGEASPIAVDRQTRLVERNLRWLRETAEAARGLISGGPFGLFGTSIAGTWLSSELKGAQAYFVDEDPSRQGRTFMGKPVIAPADVPAGGRVFVGLPPELSNGICQRLRRPGVEYFATPGFGD